MTPISRLTTPIVTTPIVTTPIVTTPITTPALEPALAPGETIPAADPPGAVEDPHFSPRKKPDLPESGDLESIKPAPQPEGGYPRKIAHNERVEYSYDPETGQYSARMVTSSEPVVVGYDQTPPAQTERPVGTWDVMPTREGLTFENNERVPVPEGVKAELKAQAEQTGEVATTISTVRYDHDLDSGETDARPTGGSSIAAKVAAIQARRNGSAGAGLSAQGRKAMDQIASARAQATRSKARRRSSSRHDKLNDSPAQLPELVVVQDPL